jgi:tetratricopeptide (TPR) repeat protein
MAGDWAKAESLYSAQLVGPAAQANYAGAVRSELAQNKLTEALATAQRATAATPTFADAQALMGDVLLRSGQIAEAAAAYTKAVQINPCTARAQFGLGRLSDLASNHATAARKFAAAHSLAPGDPEITAVYLGKLPAQQRAAGLHSLLASNPVLAPEVAKGLADQLAILDQHKSCTVSQELPSTSLELTPLMYDGRFERSWGLKVRLNDADTPLLELDSGVSGIVLNPKDAQKAGVHPLSGGATPDSPYTAVADRVRIGSLEYHDCPVRVVPAGELANSNSVIGTDFFRDHLIHIDYVAKLMPLNPLPARPGATDSAVPMDQYIAPEEKDWSPAFIAGSNILVPTLINKKGPYLFLIDSGIGRSILSPAVEHTLLSSEDEAAINLIGTSGAILKIVPRDGGTNLDVTDVRAPDGTVLKVTRPLKEPVYRFTNNEYPDQDTISFDISRKNHEVGVEASGILGFWTLQNYFLDFNYRDGLVKIQYDQNRRYRIREMEKNW